MIRISRTEGTLSMHELTALALIILGAFAFFAFLWWLEGRLRRPGLTFLVTGILGLIGAGAGLVQGIRLLPILFVVQAVAFLYLARWRRQSAHTTGVSDHSGNHPTAE
jgi:hypothetical protein